MNPNFKKITALLILGLILTISACSTPTEESVSRESATIDRTPLVNATGMVIPKQEALLSVSVGGVIEDVLVKKGDTVSAGQVLIRLEGTEQQLAAVAAAELEVASAHFALDAIYKDTNLLAAGALLSAETAEKNLEDLYNLELQQALAIKAVAIAQKTTEDTKRNLKILTNTPTKTVIDQAKANMMLAENRLDETLDQIDETEWQLKKYGKISFVAKSLRQALKGLEVKRSQDQLAYNNSQTKYNNLLEPPDQIDVEVAEAEHFTAQASLHQAQRDLERVMDGPEAGEVALLEAQIEKGYRDHETYSAGPDPDDVALALARISNAETQLAAAQATLADLELVASFDGVISELYINTSEWVAPGSPVLLIADLEHLQVETTDLGEIDVAQIEVGDNAVVTFDALPDLVLDGTVTSIAPKAAAGSGVNYPVILELNEVHPELRWGMTAFIEIEINE
jgi:multidrug efflux pump subunit AcrA (membrane-fusion protein)